MYRILRYRHLSAGYTKTHASSVFDAYQWCWARVHKLMLRPGWHNDQVSGLDILILTGHGSFGRAGGESQGLVDSVSLSYEEVRFTPFDT